MAVVGFQKGKVYIFRRIERQTCKKYAEFLAYTNTVKTAARFRSSEGFEFSANVFQYGYDALAIVPKRSEFYGDAAKMGEFAASAGEVM